MVGRNSSRKNGLFSRLWSPFGHTLKAGEESVGAVTNTAKGVVSVGARGVNTIGRSITGHFNAAVHDLIKGRKNRRTMKGGRKTTRRNRKSTRRNRKTTRRNNY